MSLRKSPKRTPDLLEAARSNSQRSTGPRSPSGKQNAKMNAVKHGERSEPENHYAVIRALGEDPEEFENLKQELRGSFGPGDELWEKQIDELARLYWRRDRLERIQTSLMRRAVLEHDEWQRTRRKQIDSVTFDSSQSWVIDSFSLPDSEDRGVQLRAQLSLLGVVRVEVRQRVFKERIESLLRPYFEHQPGWRAARLMSLLWIFVECFKLEAQLFNADTLPTDKARYNETLEKHKGDKKAYEAKYQELLRLLDAEIAEVEEEFEHEEEVQAERAAIERDACLAPEGEQWKMLLRREETLDRAIDRKIKLLESLRKEKSKAGAGAGGEEKAGEMASGAGIDILSDLATVFAETYERSGNVVENTEEEEDGISAPGADDVPRGSAAGFSVK